MDKARAFDTPKREENFVGRLVSRALAKKIHQGTLTLILPVILQDTMPISAYENGEYCSDY